MSEIDFIHRRANGCFEHEVRNIFHLALVPEKHLQISDIPRLLQQERGKIKAKIRVLMRDVDYGPGGHTAGWNAALEALLEEIG